LLGIERDATAVTARTGGAIMLLSLLLFSSEFINIVAISFTALVLNELAMVAVEVTTWCVADSKRYRARCRSSAQAFLHGPVYPHHVRHLRRLDGLPTRVLRCASATFAACLDGDALSQTSPLCSRRSSSGAWR
jgi:hypothetical protein